MALTPVPRRIGNHHATDNAFAVYLQLFGTMGLTIRSGRSTTARHNLKTGGQIPSDLLAEVDRKNDDG